MTSVKALAARFYRLKSGHAPTGVYLKRFTHDGDDKFWWCGGGGGTVARTREHLFRHCSQWTDQQTALWEAVGKATGWKAGRCRHWQISELFSRDECDQAVVDFVAVTEVGKFPPKCREGWTSGGSAHRSLRFSFPFLSFPFCSGLSLSFHFSAEIKGSGGGSSTI